MGQASKQINKSRIFIIILCISTIIINILSGCGTNKEKNDSKQEHIRFSTLSQDEKQDYVKSYLKENYGLNCDLTEIKTRQITAVKNEKDYSTVATTEDGFWFSVWITPKSEIKDTAFTYQLKDDVNTYYEYILKEKRIECEIVDKFTFDKYPSKQWKAYELDEMFTEENIINVIHLYTTEEVNLQIIEDTLADYKGAVYIHCTNPENLKSISENSWSTDKNNYVNTTWNDYDYFIDLD